MSLRIVAHVTARAGKIEETKALLLGLTGPTRKEAGCIRYELHQNNANPLDLTFIEEWESDATLDAHLQSAHLAAAFEKMPALMDGLPDIRRYTMIG